MEGGEFFAQRIYFDHSAAIKTHPALTQAITETCQSLFEAVQVTSVVEANVGDRADVILLPKVEMRERVIYLTVVAKDAASGETIQQYEAAGNVVVPIPGTVHGLAVLNGISCMLLSPIVCPIVTQILGGKANDSLERRFSSSLSQIAQDISADRVRLSKGKHRQKKLPGSD